MIKVSKICQWALGYEKLTNRQVKMMCNDQVDIYYNKWIVI